MVFTIHPLLAVLALTSSVTTSTLTTTTEPIFSVAADVSMTEAPNATHTLSPRGAGPFTINIYTRNAPSGLHIHFQDNPNVPGAINKPLNGPLKGSTKAIYPPGWAGRVAIGRDPASGNINRGSLIEASNVGNNAYDVSYIQGYSVPIVCSCSDNLNAGCNIPLFWGKAKCPELGPGNTCLNPLRDSAQGRGTAGHPFFDPCQGAAMIYPNDYDGVKNCPVNEISCCVGHGCPAAKQQKQKQKRRIGGHVRF